MRRIDIHTDEWQGFAIFDDGGPLQLMYRTHGIRQVGNDSGIYWLRPSTGSAIVPRHFVPFLCAIRDMIEDCG